MKEAHVIDSEISKKSYEHELELCQNAGGDIEVYRRLHFDVFQLEQIRLGLEQGISVDSYLDPKLNWLEMESIRKALEVHVDLNKYKSMGFDWLQCSEILEGLKNNVDISYYLDVNYLSEQMREIRKGLERGVDVSIYAKQDFDWMQMRELRRGLEEKVSVGKYADPKFNYLTMRAIRKSLAENIDLVPYAEKGYPGTVLMEVAKGIMIGRDISGYMEKGYNADQLHQINVANEYDVNLTPYLYREFHGAQLEQIIKGLVRGLDVSKYASREYNWMQMRELRHGIEDHVDISQFMNPDFTPKQMEEIHKGLLAGIDVSSYAKIYYEPAQMEQMRREIEERGAALTEEMEELLRSTIVSDSEVLHEEEVKEEVQDDFLLDSCVFVSKDKMKVYADFSSIKDTMSDVLDNLTVLEMLRILKHHNVKQGIKRDVIDDLITNRRFSEPIVVAEGKPAVNGEDGKFEFHFRQHINHTPKVLNDGSVDYKNMELFEAVEQNMLLAEYHPATRGVFGYNVEGKLLSPLRGKEKVPLKGSGFLLSEDKRQYYSTMSGIVEYDEEKHELNIRKQYVIDGNVNSSTGNINFNGDVHITGNVESGFSVNATGNIVIDGNCEGCKIYSGRDIVIRKGCQGRNVGEICAAGNLVGQFFESIKIITGGDVEASYLLNCKLQSAGMLKVSGRKGIILGGYISAKLGVDCYGIGNIAEIKTVIEVGIDKDDMRDYQELIKQIEKIDAELKTCEVSLTKFMELPVRDEKTIALCERLTKAVYTQKLKKKELIQEREKKMLRMTQQRGARVSVAGSVYPGTTLYINSDPYQVSDIYNNVYFVKKDSIIDIIPR